jgi:hypothetical protein
MLLHTAQRALLAGYLHVGAAEPAEPGQRQPSTPARCLQNALSGELRIRRLGLAVGLPIGA